MLGGISGVLAAEGEHSTAELLLASYALNEAADATVARDMAPSLRLRWRGETVDSNAHSTMAGEAGGTYHRVAPPPDLFRPSSGSAVTLGSATDQDPVYVIVPS